MNLIYTVLLAFPIGFFVRSRGIAVLSYLLAGSYVFAYGHVNLVITLAGVGLVVLGHRVASNRGRRHAAITVG